MSYIVPLIPVTKNLTKDNLVDNFDEKQLSMILLTWLDIKYIISKIQLMIMMRSQILC